MQHAISTHKIHLTRHGSYTAGSSVAIGLINKFITWCGLQEKNRFMWLGVAFMGGIGAMLPLTLCAIVFFWRQRHGSVDNCLYH